MSGLSSPVRRVRAPSGGESGRRRALDGESLAWLLVVPCGLALVAAVALLGAPLGRLLYPPLDPDRLWNWNRSALAPESSEQAGYLLALIAAVALAALIAALARPGARRGARAMRAAPLVRLALATMLVACVVAQYQMRYQSGTVVVRARYFTPTTWAVAAAIAAGIALALRTTTVRRRLRALLRERPAKRWLATGLAVSLTAVAMLPSIDSDATIDAHQGVQTIIAYVMDEAFAVVNGLTPLVDFQPPYATLWPVLAAAPLAIIAPTLLVLTLTFYALSVTALIAIFGVLRRTAASSAAALLLYVPFLSTSLFLFESSTSENAYSAGNYFPAFPLRYAGPYLLAWLTARAIGASPARSHRLLFTAGGLVVLNNANFGLPALLGTVAAVGCTAGPLRRSVLVALLRDFAIGLLAAVAAVCALTLMLAGKLPNLAQQLEYASFFLGGYSATPIPGYLGLHVILYLTFAGALAAAALRAAQRAANRVLTGMLAWSSVFGLGAGSYFVAESGPFQMRIVFSTWAFTLSLLALLVIERLAARPRRWPSLADAAVLLGVGVMACSIPQLPRPWQQVERLRAGSTAHGRVGSFVPDPSLRSYVGSIAYGRHAFYLKPGVPVALLLEEGHRLAAAFDVVDISRYTGTYPLFGPAFLRRVVEDLRRAGGNTVIVPTIPNATQDFIAALARWGFAPATSRGVGSTDPRAVPIGAVVSDMMTVKWVDQRNLHPAALRGDRGRLVARFPSGG
jgi:hypothetical protein